MLTLLCAAAFALSTPKSTVVDLWRGYPGADKVYVQVGTPDGGTALFLVDTGAAVSVVTEEAAERLGLTSVDAGGRVAGLSGSVAWRRATLPWIQIGDFRIDNVDVATGVPGIPDHAGAIPVDGILGHNVWRNWTLVVDYPADRLELHRPGTYKPRGKGQGVSVTSTHVGVDVRIEASRAHSGGGKFVAATVGIEIDTGAGDTSLWCQTGEPFRELTTLGVEPVFGIGAALDKVPDFQFLTETRHIPATLIEVGGRSIKRTLPIRWSSPDNPAADVCAVSRGLLGYSTLGVWRTVIDYPGQRLVLEAPRTRRTFDAMAAWLKQDAARHAEALAAGDLRSAGERARVLIAHDELPAARELVSRALAANAHEPVLVALAARIERFDGNDEASIERLAVLSPVEMVEEGIWGELIGTLIALGREKEALTRAEASLSVPVNDPDVRQELLVAYSDVLLALGRPAEAERALDEAIAVDRGGSGFLFRRALVALESGDRYGAITTLRQLLDVYPVGGHPMWLYAMSLKDADRATFRADVDRALGRLHPGAEPLDFVGAALHLVRDDAAAKAALSAGYERDCKPFRRGPGRDNCDAWYWALGEERVADAQRASARAVAADPNNAAYRDTAAVVAYAAGDVAQASVQAQAAARLSPDDPYLIWQARRFSHAAKARGTP